MRLTRFNFIFLVVLAINLHFCCSKCSSVDATACLSKAFLLFEDPCQIEMTHHQCLLEIGCMEADLPTKLCSKQTTSDKKLNKTPKMKRDHELEWLLDRKVSTHMTMLELELEQNEQTFGIGLGQQSESWGPVVVNYVAPDSAASRAGVLVGDEVIQLGPLLRTVDIHLELDILPILKKSTSLIIHMQRVGMDSINNFSLCEFKPCFDESTPCYGSHDSFICACPPNTEGRACRPVKTQMNPSIAKPRVALVLSGQPRFFSSHGSVSVQQHILKQYRADVFFHVWWSQNQIGNSYSVAPWTGLRTGPDSSQVNIEDNVMDRLLEIYHPKLYLFEAQRTSLGGGRNEKASGIKTDQADTYLSRNLPDILYSVAKAGALKLAYEMEHGFSYDIVVKARFDTFLGNFPDLFQLPFGYDKIYTQDATRLLLGKNTLSNDDGGHQLLSVKRSTTTMGREDVLHISSSRLHDMVWRMHDNMTELIAATGSTHVVQLLRTHLINLDALDSVVEFPSMINGLVRGDFVVDEMKLYALKNETCTSDGGTAFCHTKL